MGVETGLQVVQGLARSAAALVEPGQVKRVETRIGRQLVRFLHRGLRFLQPAGHEEALTHQVVGRPGIAQDELERFFLQPVLLGIGQGLQDPGEAVGRLGILLGQMVDAPGFHLQQQAGDRGVGLLERGQSLGVEGDRLPPLALLGQVGRQLSQQHGVGIVQGGDFQSVADRLLVPAQLLGRRQDGPGDRQRIGIEAERPLVQPQGAG